MTQERIKCPFCSELILRDAIKCRFCGEWFSMPDEIVEVGRVQDPAPDDAGGRASQEIVDAGPAQVSSPGDGGDSEDRDLPVADVQEIFQSAEAIIHGGGASERVDEGKAKQTEDRKKAAEAAPARVAREVVSAERLEAAPGLLRRGARIPWVRAAILLLYLGVAAALVVCESRAQAILSDALKQERTQDYKTAFATYGRILDSFPFSFATIEAWRGAGRIAQSQQIDMPKPNWLVAGEKLLGGNLVVQEVHLLPLAAWAVSAVLLFLVCLTRIFRPGIALLALLLTILALAGFAAQLAWYGLIPLTPAVDVMRDLMQESVTVYFASYLLVVLTVLMTLTGTARRPSLQMAKMATAVPRTR